MSVSETVKQVFRHAQNVLTDQIFRNTAAGMVVAGVLSGCGGPVTAELIAADIAPGPQTLATVCVKETYRSAVVIDRSTGARFDVAVRNEGTADLAAVFYPGAQTENGPEFAVRANGHYNAYVAAHTIMTSYSTDGARVTGLETAVKLTGDDTRRLEARMARAAQFSISKRFSGAWLNDRICGPDDVRPFAIDAAQPSAPPRRTPKFERMDFGIGK